METQIATVAGLVPAAAPAPHEVPAQLATLLAHELKLAAGAIALVESGGAPRVTLVGMRGGRDLVVRALAMASTAPVLVRARWWPEGDALDLVVESHG